MSVNLDKLTMPQSSVKMQLQISGIYAYPQQWKTTDQANPGTFTYMARVWKSQISKGKIAPRQLTEKELREQQESKKKGGKKQSKKQQNSADEQKLKQQRQQQEQEQRKRQEEWNKLSQQQKFYSTSQDPFKSAVLKFQDCKSQTNLCGKNFIVFEQRVTKDQGEWVYIYKVPAINEEQIAKMKKSKPKNLNINDLNPVVMRAWVNLSELNSSQNKETVVRCKLQQVEKTADSPQPNLQKTYIKVRISLDRPLLKKSDGVESKAIINDPPKEKQIPPEIACVNELKDELKLALQSLAMQYAGMFWKQLNMYEEQKNNQIFTNLKRNQISKRKEQFLYDFNISGKYKILKDRMKKSIVKLCKQKFGQQTKGMASFTGVSCNAKDQFYSQIYHFLVTNYKQTIKQMIYDKKQSLRQVQVPNQKTQSEMIKKYLQSYHKEQLGQRVDRVIKQNQSVYLTSYGQRVLKYFIEKNPKNTQLKYQYAIFCLRNNLASPQEVLPYFQQHLEHNKDSSQLQFLYLLMLITTEDQLKCRKAWIILRQLIQKEPNNTDYLALASLLFEFYLQSPELGQKYYFLAERNILRTSGKLKQIGKHQQDPSESQIPNTNGQASYKAEIDVQQKDRLWFAMIDLFSSYNLFNVVSRIKLKIANQENPSIKMIAIKIMISENKLMEALEQAQKLYQASKNYEILCLIMECLFKSYQIEKLEAYLKTAIKSCPSNDRQLHMFRLGSIYTSNGKYANGKACLVKYLQKQKINSGLSWRLLGICELNLNQVASAIQCLRHSNLLDPLNANTWLQLSLAYTMNKQLIMANQCLNQYYQLSNNEDADQQVFKRIKEQLRKNQSADFYQSEIRERLVNRVTQQIVS